ncbi:ATP-binding protein [Actinoplanes italicus]|nr:ATP-binding protein [Actinoplanes italicus]
MTTTLLDQLRRLHLAAGEPSRSQLKKDADLGGHHVGRSTLDEALTKPGASWPTVAALVDACVRHARRSGRPLTAEQRDPAQWRSLYEAGRRTSTSAVRLIGLIPPAATHFQSRPVAEAGVRVLSGLGGVGKTQLAAAHARARLAAGDLVIWADASSRDAIVSRWADAGEQLSRATPADPERAAQRFLSWLATASRPWLIVLDDLADPRDLRGLQPPAGTAAGQILITTRLRDTAAVEHGEPVEIGVFTEAEAGGYLRAALPGRLADDVAGVSADLGRLPVAMAQAAAYMTDLDISCTEYRRRFADRRRRMDDLFPAEDRVPGDYRWTVPVTWSLSIEAADRSSPAGLARPLLEMAGVLDSGGIPADVFTAEPARTWFSYTGPTESGAPQWRERGADEIRDGLRRLHLFSLVTFEDGLVRVHDLVQRAVRDRTDPDRLDAVAWAAGDALLAAWPYDEGARAQSFRASAAALDRHTGGSLWTGDEYHAVLTVAGRSLGEAGQVAAAAEHFRELHALSAERLGADHPYTLAALGNRTIWQGETGDHASTTTARELVDARRRVFGDDHPDTLTARHTLARQHMRDGDFDSAAAELESILRTRTAILGPAHPDTLTAWHNLATCRGENDPAAAADEFENVLAKTREVLGDDHPDTLSSRHELARWRSAAENPEQAAAEFEALLADRIRVLGPDHPQTLSTRSELIHATTRSGRETDPAGRFAALLDDQLRILGPDHPETLRTRLNLVDAGRGEPEEVLDDLIRVVGPAHPMTAQAAFLRALIRDPEDLMLSVPEGLWQAMLRVLGPDDPWTAGQGELVAAIREHRSRE